MQRRLLHLLHGLHGGGVNDDFVSCGREVATGVVEEGAALGRGGQVLAHGVEVELGVLGASVGLEDDGSHGALVVAHAADGAFQVIQQVADIGLLGGCQLDTGALGDIDIVQVHERTRVDGAALGLGLLQLLDELGVFFGHIAECLLQQGIGLLLGDGGQLGEVIGEGAQLGQINADEARHQLAAAHPGEPTEAAVGLLPLGEAVEGGGEAGGDEVLIEEVDELCAALGIVVGLAQPGCLVEDELLQLLVAGEGGGGGGGSGGRTAGNRA